jgi:hypothetical protein
VFNNVVIINLEIINLEHVKCNEENTSSIVCKIIYHKVINKDKQSFIMTSKQKTKRHVSSKRWFSSLANEYYFGN